MKRQTRWLLAGPIVFILPVAVLLASSKDKVAGIPDAPSASEVCPPPWQLVADMPQDLYGGAATSNGTYAYVAGGYSLGTATTLDVFNRFDPAHNTWAPLASLPDATMMASAVYYPVSNKIYVFGGEDPNTAVCNNATRIYDIATNTWSAGANMPDVRAFMASGYNSTNGKIYLVSGYNTGSVNSAQPDTWEYDPVANTFTPRAAFPHPVGGAASGVIAGHLYVAGGRDASATIVNLVWDYDITADTWTAKASMPGTDTNVPGSAVALDRLWVYGGGSPFGPTRDARSTTAFATERVKGQLVPNTTNGAMAYDPATDSWSAAPNLNVQRSFPAGAAIGTKLIAAGGFNGTTSVASAEVLDACIPEPPPPPCDSGLILNGGFETGDFTSWVIDGSNATPVVTSTQAHSGASSAFAGDAPDGFCGVQGAEANGDSSFYQQFTVPASGGTLSFWHWDCTADTVTFDWQDAYITDSSGNILQTIFHQALNTQAWVNTTVDMTPYAGQTVRVKFLVHEDGFDDLTGMYVDDVVLLEPCQVTGITPTSGPAAGGTSVIISGVGFQNGATVSIGGVAATNVIVISLEEIDATTPALSPGTLNDVSVTNPTSRPEDRPLYTAILPQGWLADFLDIPQGDIFHDYVEKIFRNGITAGCGGGNYCRDNPVRRDQMAVFLLKAERGSSYTPPNCTGVFLDVPCPGTFTSWVEELAAEGITGGCGGGNYCPANPVTRQQMAVFLLKTKHGSSYIPPACAGIFGDVPCPSQFADWIEQLFHESITGGCGGGNYCPGNPNTRGQMAVFLVKTFGF